MSWAAIADATVSELPVDMPSLALIAAFDEYRFKVFPDHCLVADWHVNLWMLRELGAGTGFCGGPGSSLWEGPIANGEQPHSDRVCGVTWRRRGCCLDGPSGDQRAYSRPRSLT